MLTDLVLVEAENPFANDLLDRSTFVTNLKQILLSGDRGIVLGLNGAWGTGKTTCVEFLRQDLINTGHVVIVLNAWADDHVSDPLIAVMASLIDDENFKRHIKDHDLVARLTQIGKNVLGLAAQSGLSLLSIGTVSPGDIARVIEVETDYSKVLSKYNDEKKEINALRDVLIEVSQYLKNDEDKKLIIIVDELDRCKPTYAISLFERIKHVLEVDNLRVLLSFDQEQLEATVRKHYGSKVDANRYLEKMFDLIINLPISDLSKLFKKTIESLNLPVDRVIHSPPYRQGSIDELLEFLLILLKATHASARELQRTLTRIHFLWSRSSGLRVDPVYAVVLLILRSQSPKIFAKIKNGHSSFSEIDLFFKKFAGGSRYWNGNFQNYIETLYYIKQDSALDTLDLTSIPIESQAFSVLPLEIQSKRQRMQAYIFNIRNDSVGSLQEMALAVDLVIS